jgi:hypothetical protein
MTDKAFTFCISMIAMMQPKESWVAKWQRIGTRRLMGSDVAARGLTFVCCIVLLRSPLDSGYLRRDGVRGAT